MRALIFVVLSSILSAPPLAAGLPTIHPAELVADLETVFLQGSSRPGSSAELDGALLFTARNATGGLTLWRSDGTSGGTRELADLAPGAEALGSSRLVPLGDGLAFTVGFRDLRRDLWTSDGTEAGTRLVAHLPNPRAFFPPSPPVTLGDRVYLTADDPDLGPEVWVSDGTAAGTRVLFEHCAGRCGSYPFELTAVGDRLHFTTLGSGEPIQLWVSDGTAAGTRTLDVCPGGCASGPGDLLAHGDLLLFRADDGVHGLEPWVSDGTEAGTRLLADLDPGTGGSDANFLTVFSLGEVLYFTATTGEDGAVEIWRTDGKPEGTALATEFLDAGRDGLPAGWVSTEDRVYFSLEELRPAEGLSDRELWVLETPGEAPLRVATGFVQECCSGLSGAPLGDGRLLFSAGTLETGDELWITDGTGPGTRPVREIRPGAGSSYPRPVGRVGERVLLAADDGEHGEEPWISDGTAAGTFLLRDLLPAQASADPAHLTVHAGELYFTTGPGRELVPGELHPRRLWRVNPSAPPELLVEDGADYAEIVSTGSDLYFLPAFRTTLLAVQPAPAFLLADLGDGASFAGLLGELTPSGDRLFFGTRGGGQELWLSDGTRAGTRLVADVRPDWLDTCTLSPCAPGSSYFPRELTAVGDAVYFLARSGEAPEIWTSDGTAAGTVPVPAAVDDAGSLAAAGDRLVFGGLVDGRWQLWSTDGTGPGTRLLALFDLGEIPGPTRTVGTRAYVVTRHPEDGLRLWRSDGTAAGTRLVALLGGARRFEDVTELAGAGGRLYLSLFTGGLGQELWTSDGTPSGTRRVADLRPGPGGSWPTALSPAGSFLAFTAEGPDGGREPWLTDGTARGTVRLADVAPGPGGSAPLAFASLSDTLYFDADDGEAGRELWSVRLSSEGDGQALPPPADATPLLAPEYPGFRFWVRITHAGQVLPTRRELLCIPETVCVSGAIPGRAELFLRIVGPKPNGRLWPTLVRFSTSTIDVWIEQVSTGLLRHYRLDGATPGSSDLDGLFDRQGFPP